MSVIPPTLVDLIGSKLGKRADFCVTTGKIERRGTIQW
ncbi:hypothetical protein THTE_0443 [Thermogutta terrifontis]|uniref:Uncharacterized protein n=1 Tax=Thermogutta terrifontis TaxID=1331910 RepID=A0A286RAQ1_9BACT|nr:hypothetical protein THTE_0443 [Thermogutta terrifontis]